MKRVNGVITLSVMLLLGLLVAACAVQAPAPAAPQAAPAQEEEAAPAAEEAAEEAAAEEESPAADEEMAVSDRCGERSQLSDQLNFFNWADYIDENILTQFEEECGVEVVMDLYTSNEEALAKIQAGNSGYDLYIPTDYAVKLASDADLLEELDMSLIPNAENVDPQTMGMYYDPDNTYSLPYQWSTTGLAYNTTAFEEAPDSWAAVYDLDQLCEHSGFVSMLNDERETLATTLFYLGYSPNETDPQAHEEAKELLLDQKDCLSGYNSDNFIQTLAAEEVVLAHAWGFAAAIARSENPNVAYVIPREGGVIWQDNMVIPKDAPHKYTAYVFLNYLLEPDIGAQLTEWTFGFTPNLEAEKLLSEDYYELMESGGMLVDDETHARLEWLRRGEGAEIFSDTWTSVLAQ